MENLEENNYIFRRILIKLGKSSNIKDFYYILKSIEIVKKQQIHTNITTVYEMLSKNDENTKYGIERSIRNSIAHSYKTNIVMKRIYADKPKNANFIYDLAFNTDIFEKEIKKMKVGD